MWLCIFKLTLQANTTPALVLVAPWHKCAPQPSTSSTFNLQQLKLHRYTCRNSWHFINWVLTPGFIEKKKAVSFHVMLRGRLAKQRKSKQTCTILFFCKVKHALTKSMFQAAAEWWIWKLKQWRSQPCPGPTTSIAAGAWALHTPRGRCLLIRAVRMCKSWTFVGGGQRHLWHWQTFLSSKPFLSSVFGATKSIGWWH